MYTYNSIYFTLLYWHIHYFFFLFFILFFSSNIYFDSFLQFSSLCLHSLSAFVYCLLFLFFFFTMTHIYQWRCTKSLSILSSTFNFPDCQAGSQKFGRFEFTKQKLFLHRKIFIIATRNYNIRRELSSEPLGGMSKTISLLNDWDRMDPRPIWFQSLCSFDNTILLYCCPI